MTTSANLPTPIDWRTQRDRRMSPALTRVDSFGYNVTTPILSKKTKTYNLLRWLVGLGLFASYLIFYPKQIGFWLFVVGIVGLVVFLKLTGRKVANQTQQLLIFTRYIILGDEIVYYQNLQTMHIDEQIGQIVLTLKATGHRQPAQLVIVRNEFQCVTKKPDKIRLRQQEKFAKVCQDLRQLVSSTNPQVAITHV